MKKTLSILLALAMAFTLAACGATPGQGNDASDSGQENAASDPAPETGAPTSGTPETPPADQPGSAAPQEDELSKATDSGDRKILIAYFSATNTTESIANHLDTILDADLYEIVPETPYTSDDLNYNDSSSRSSQEMDDPDARPAISSSVENMEQYDVIFLGYPIWWGEAPRIINTFLESYDLSGKTIAPFCTSASSPLGSSAANLQELTGSATWLEGQRFSGGASASDVQSWVDSLNLNG